MDLCLKYGNVTLGIELKAWRDKRGDPFENGLEQLDSYLARLGVNFGWLIIFDRRSKALPIEERLTTQTDNHKKWDVRSQLSAHNYGVGALTHRTPIIIR